MDNTDNADNADESPAVAPLFSKYIFERSDGTGHFAAIPWFLDALVAGRSPRARNGLGVDIGLRSLAMSFLSVLAAATNASGAVQADPQQPKPTYRVETNDVATGRTIMRIANDAGRTTRARAPLDPAGAAGTWGTRARHHYMTDQPWSSNQSFYFMENSGTGGHLVLDGHTFAPLMHVCPNILLHDGSPAGVAVRDSWWYLPHKTTDEEFRVAIDTAPDVRKLFVYSVLTCQIKREAGFDFVWTTDLTGGLSAGVTDAQSWGDHGAVEVVVDASRTHLQVIDMIHNIKGPVLDAYAGGTCGAPHVCTGLAKNFCATNADCAAPATCSACIIDWAGVSPSGNYLVVSYDQLDFVRVFHIDPATMAVAQVDYTTTGQVFSTVSPDTDAEYCVNARDKGFIFNVGHASLGVNPYDGNADVIVGARHCSNKGTSQFSVTSLGSVVMVKLQTGVVSALTHHTDAIPESTARHVSLLSYDDPGWAIVSYNDADPATACPANKYWDEIVRVSLQGEAAGVERLARSHTLSGADTTADTYSCEAHAVPSPDGVKVAFASCWAKSCGAVCGDIGHPQDYVIDRSKPPSWSAPPHEVSPAGDLVPLTIGKSGTSLVVAFAESAGASTYNVYRGSLTNLRHGIYDHTASLPLCGLVDASAGDGLVSVTVAGATVPDGSYLLVIARNALGESAYGSGPGGAPVPPATNVCP